MAKKLATATAIVAIMDSAVLGQRLGAFRTAYVRSHTMAQQMAVSCLRHAADTGDPVHLNTFVNILKTNDRDAFRNYIRRIFACVGGWDGVTAVSSDEMLAHKQRGEFLKISNGAFRVMRNEESEWVGDAKAGMIALVPTLLNPDGKVWKAFLDRNNFAETKTFGPDDLRRGLQTLLNKAQGERKGVDADIPDEMIAALTAAQRTIGQPEAASKSLLH